MLLALFIAVVATPPLRWLRGKGMPKYLAVLLILLVLVDIASLVALTTTSALEALREGLPSYQERLVLPSTSSADGSSSWGLTGRVRPCAT